MLNETDPFLVMLPDLKLEPRYHLCILTICTPWFGLADLIHGPMLSDEFMPYATSHHACPSLLSHSLQPVLKKPMHPHHAMPISSRPPCLNIFSPNSRLLPLLHTRNLDLLNQALRRRVRPHHLALDLPNPKLRLQHPDHAQQPPRRIARLRAHAHPVPRARNVEPDVFPRASVGVAWSWGLRLGVVGAEDFEGARVAGCSGGALEELELGVEIGGWRGEIG
jgi:hypothetical protein